MNPKNLVRLYEAKGGQELRETLLAEPSLARGLPMAKVFEGCFSPEAWLRYKRMGHREAAGRGIVHALTEAEGAVSTSAFLNITGQIVFSWVMDPMPGEEDYPFTKVIPEVGPVMTLQEEKIPGLTQLGDVSQPRYEGDPYALAGFGEDWIHRPALVDDGFIVPVTWEAVFEDKTGNVQAMAQGGGRSMRLKREKKAIDCVIDQNRTIHRYKWRGVTIATYGDNSGTHSWDNLTAANALVDWTDVDNALQTFNALTDPYTGEPLAVEPRHLVAAKGLQQTALRILSATEIRVTTPGYATSANPTQTVRSNPYANLLEYVTSRQLAARMTAAGEATTDWFIGDLAAFARWFWAEKMDTTKAPSDHPDNFHRRIIDQYRCNERGEYSTIQPRAMQKNTVS